MQEWKQNPHMRGKNIIPVKHGKGKTTIEDLIKNYEKGPFEGRNIAAGAKLYKEMIGDDAVIWLGIAGAGVAGGMGGYIIDLISRGFIDVICTTGAQVYHDLHFAFGLPVVQGDPRADDEKLKKSGVVRIYDTYILEKETLLAQDEIVRPFAEKAKKAGKLKVDFSSAAFNYLLGSFTLKKAKYPKRSFIATAAAYGVPIFWDSESNHSIGLDNARLYLDGIDIAPHPSLDILESAAIVYSSKQTGFIELGGGGPKNFIQQTGPIIQQILGIKHEGGDYGLQITTATERDGGLSGCTFGESHTWGKYKNSKNGLVQIWGEYSIIFPLIVNYIIEKCEKRKSMRLIDKNELFYNKLTKAYHKTH